MSSLPLSHLRSLDYALKRDIRTDKFVIKSTINKLLKNHNIVELCNLDGGLCQKMLDLLESYLTSPEVVEVRVEITFSIDPDGMNHYAINNLNKIHELKNALEVIKNKQKKRPEGLR